jgi:hypothetical protein
MVSVVGRVGRLVEIRCIAPITAEDVATLIRDIQQFLDTRPERALSMVDLRQLGLVDPQLIDRVVAFMRAENPRVERSAFLMADSGALQTMQLERMLKQAGSPSRRLFKWARDAEAWLGELLSPAERARLHVFLSET